jgi:hypothetical protein
LAEEGRTDKDIAEALHTSPSTVEWVCPVFADCLPLNAWCELRSPSQQVGKS